MGLNLGLVTFPGAYLELRAARREASGLPSQLFAALASGVGGAAIAMQAFVTGFGFWKHLSQQSDPQDRGAPVRALLGA
jgi:hypothetical protein